MVKRKPAKVSRTKPASTGPAKKTRLTGEMRSDEILTIDAFCERFKVTRNHIIEMRKKGLIVRAESEKNLRIVGSDYHDFLRTQPKAELASANDA